MGAAVKPTIQTDKYTLYLGDCLEVIQGMEENSIDAIITDLPYGTTACTWDEIIPFEPMWEGVRHVLKPNGVFVTTASQPFTSKLVMSNLEWFKYELVWNKKMVTNVANAKKQPLRSHENIVVFYEETHVYNPQYGSAGKPFGKLSETSSEIITTSKLGTNYQVGVGYPKSILEYPRPNNLTGGGLHPTQKPIALYEYLIRTYTNPGEIVLDICFGSGTTGVAALQLGRRFIGCEIDLDYFEIARKRLEAAAMQPPLFTEKVERKEPEQERLL